MRADEVIVLAPGEGRAYRCGPMRALFRADVPGYTVSEWWVDAHRVGVGRHVHDANEELFYVLEGTMTFQVGAGEVEAAAGSFLRIPAGVEHGFENRTAQRAGVLNVFIPGGFEQEMPGIVAWYAEHPEGV